MKYAIVTPSYAPDFERCRLLNESIRRFLSGEFHNYILIEPRDRRLFSALRGPRTTLVELGDVLPRWLRRVPGFDAGWISFKTLPVRNWIVQQVVKLSAALVLDEPAQIFADSDMAFVRPFDVGAFERDGDLRLYRVPEVAKLPTHMSWHRAAGDLLGLPISDYFGSTYIGHPTTWRREVVLALHAKVEGATGRPWAEAICRRWNFSEYILYGIFVEHVVGMKAAGHFACGAPLSHNSWDFPMETDADVAAFFGSIRPEHAAVMVSSKQGLPVDRYRPAYEVAAARRAAVASGGKPQTAVGVEQRG